MPFCGIVENMNNVIDCFVGGIKICIHMNWRNVGEKFKVVCVDLCVRVWIITLETTIVFQAWTNVPAFNAVLVPGPTNLGLFMN